MDRGGAAKQNKRDSAEIKERLTVLRKGKGPVLFNLADEPNEMTDLSATYPEKVREMRALAEKRLADIKRNVIPLVE